MKNMASDAVLVEFIVKRMNDYAEDGFYMASMILDTLLIAWKREKEK